MNKEIWKDIREYEGLYQVSNLGRVKSLTRTIKRNKMGDFIKNGIIMNTTEHKGYISIILSKNGVSKRYKVHRLVAQEFIPNPNNYPEVNHKNEIKTDNRVENLEWCSHLYNMRYGTWKTRRKENFDYSHCYKKVNQYDMKDNFIKSWENISLAEKELNINHISDCCNGKRKTAGGYKWKHANN